MWTGSDLSLSAGCFLDTFPSQCLSEWADDGNCTWSVKKLDLELISSVLPVLTLAEMLEFCLKNRTTGWLRILSHNSVFQNINSISAWILIFVLLFNGPSMIFCNESSFRVLHVELVTAWHQFFLDSLCSRSMLVDWSQTMAKHRLDEDSPMDGSRFLVLIGWTMMSIRYDYWRRISSCSCYFRLCESINEIPSTPKK